LKNGALLSAAEEAGFDLFSTADQELSYQQNLTGRKIALLVLITNNWSQVKSHTTEIMAAVDSSNPGKPWKFCLRRYRPLAGLILAIKTFRKFFP